MDRLRWMRVVGDTIFAAGALVLGYFVLGLITGHSHDKRGRVEAGEAEVHGITEAHAHAGD